MKIWRGILVILLMMIAAYYKSTGNIIGGIFTLLYIMAFDVLWRIEQ